MTRTRIRRGLLAGAMGLALSGCAQEPSVGGDLALLFIPTPFRIIGCVMGGCERTPVEDEYEGEVSAQ